MNRIISLVFTFFISILAFSQRHKIYIATVKENRNIENYVKHVNTNVVLIDFMKLDKKKWTSYLKKCSGLLLSGGYDIDPSCYGKSTLSPYCKTENHRDEIELELLNYAMKDSLPILGICRGMQLLNVYFKGELCVDIPTFCSTDSTQIIHRDPKQQKDVTHPITIQTNSELFSILGIENTTVNSWHHQCVSFLGENLKVAAQSPDKNIESIEWQNGLNDRWILGVQWHPERFYKEKPENIKIIEAFISECKKKRNQ